MTFSGRACHIIGIEGLLNNFVMYLKNIIVQLLIALISSIFFFCLQRYVFPVSHLLSTAEFHELSIWSHNLEIHMLLHTDTPSFLSLKLRGSTSSHHNRSHFARGRDGVISAWLGSLFIIGAFDGVGVYLWAVLCSFRHIKTHHTLITIVEAPHTEEMW